MNEYSCTLPNIVVYLCTENKINKLSEKKLSEKILPEILSEKIVPEILSEKKSSEKILLENPPKKILEKSSEKMNKMINEYLIKNNEIYQYKNILNKQEKIIMILIRINIFIITFILFLYLFDRQCRHLL